MTVEKSIRITLLLITAISLLMVYYSNYYENEILAVRKISRGNTFLETTTIFSEPRPQSDYVINQPNCKMLAPDPWHESLKRYLRKPVIVQCSNLPLLTIIDQQDGFSNVLRINEGAIKMYKGKQNDTLKCFYRVIKRVSMSPRAYNMSADNLYRLSSYKEFTKQVLLSNDTEFIHVKCNRNRDRKKKPIYNSGHSVVPLLPEVIEKFSKQTTKHSIVILGLDSISKLNLRRNMPRTLKYLKNTNWIELRGYNKIDDNTFPNLMAILTGENAQQLHKCWNNNTKNVDDCFMLWSEYSRKGYITFYAEDTPRLGTFNYRKTGFVNKPTDYYIRPFMVAAHEILTLKKAHAMPVCLGPVLAVDHILNYSKRFLRAFNSTNHFSLLWLNSLSHNDMNLPKALDISVHSFLQGLSSLGIYDNSFVFVLSDHGTRFGLLRESFLGFLEDRMPFMFIWTPKWFREQHPDKYRSLFVNQDRLTTPFDVYVTLRKLLDEGDVPEPVSAGCPKCKGLFEEQPWNRSCEEAAIPIRWCLCSEFRRISNKKAVKKAVMYLRELILNNTKEAIARVGVDPSLCSNWTFRKMLRAHELIPIRKNQQYSLTNLSKFEMKRQEDEERDSNTKILIILLEFNPGRTKFETMVQMSETAGNDGIVVMEHPRRVGGFYMTSYCVDDEHLKAYCYCSRNVV